MTTIASESRIGAPAVTEAGSTISDVEIVSFESAFAGTVAAWVDSPDILFLLAPSTRPPLSAADVLNWLRPNGRAYLLQRCGQPEPIGYAELNPMPSDRRHWWLGHVVVKPAFCGQGVGRRFVRLLLVEAFLNLSSVKVSLVVFPENKPAVRCYTRVGLRARREEFHQFGGKGPRHRLLRYEVTPDWLHSAL